MCAINMSNALGKGGKKCLFRHTGRNTTEIKAYKHIYVEIQAIQKC